MLDAGREDSATVQNLLIPPFLVAPPLPPDFPSKPVARHRPSTDQPNDPRATVAAAPALEAGPSGNLERYPEHR